MHPIVFRLFRSDCLKVLASVGMYIENKESIREKFSSMGSELSFEEEVQKERMADYEILLVGFTPSSKIAELVAQMPSLKMLQTLSAGVERLPFSRIPEHVLICSNAGAYALPIAEHAIAMMLSLGKRLKYNELRMRDGIFDQSSHNRLFAGKTLGVLGYGGIGRATANIARCFGMKIYGIGRRECNECDYYGDMSRLDDFLSKSDAVLISIPLNKYTRGLINRSKLELMKKDGILINVARAEIVVEDDLFEHVRSNPSFGCAIDVWWDEPRHGSPFKMKHDFLSLPNVIASPHNSGIVDGIEEMALTAAMKNIALFASGKMPGNVVRREDYV